MDRLEALRVREKRSEIGIGSSEEGEEFARS
jgi:hypothetical protein